MRVMNFSLSKAPKWNVKDLPKLELADVVLKHHYKIASYLMRLGMHSYWNHAAIVIVAEATDCMIVENTAAGVVLNTLVADVNAHIAIYRHEGLSDEQRLKIAGEAKALVGKNNDWHIGQRVARSLGWESPKVLWDLWMDKEFVPIPHVIDEYFLCSEIVQESYFRAGVEIINDEHLLLPKTIVLLSRQGKVFTRIWGQDKI